MIKINIKKPNPLSIVLVSSLMVFAIFSIGLYIKNRTEISKNLEKNNFEITYNENGYFPRVIEIPVGTKVKFKNESKITMWTASDPHPTHTDYPEFDSDRDYRPDETFIFQFNKLGTFGYHNHEKSIHRGIIKVFDPNKTDVHIDKTKEDQWAIRDAFFKIFDQNDPDSIFKVIDALQTDKEIANDCHDMSHDLGHRAYELFGFSTAMTFNNPNRLGHTSVDDVCAGGYMHGILEELFLNQPYLKDNPKDICSSIPENNRGSCFHGVGHGLMFVNKRDVPLSLSICRNLKQLTDTYRCFEGVWMEMFWGETEHAGANSLGWTIDTPLAPCINAKQDEKPTCFLYSNLGYLRTHKQDFHGIVNFCTTNNLEDSDEKFCIKGTGITMMKHFTSQNLIQTEDFATNLKPSLKYAYYEGVIGYSQLSSVSDDDLKTFCNSLKNDDEICSAVLKNNPQQK